MLGMYNNKARQSSINVQTPKQIENSKIIIKI